MEHGLRCWSCGDPLAELTLPLRRLEACRRCGAELYACRMCRHFDVRVAKSCREPVAEEVKDKERANFCDYLEPSPDAYRPADPAATQARSKLEALFGPGPGTTAAQTSAPDPADEARARLEALFRK